MAHVVTRSSDAHQNRHSGRGALHGEHPRRASAVKWKAFFSRQAKNPKYLQHGDVVEASITTDDGAIDLGTQRMAVRHA